MLRRAILVCLFVACSAPAGPKGGATPGGPGEAEPGKAEPGKVEPGEVEPGEVDPGEVDPGAKEWRRGTVTVGPDGTFALRADDDSVTVCAPELAPELREKGLAIRFRGEVIPPAPNERRWCSLIRDLAVERAP